MTTLASAADLARRLAGIAGTRLAADPPDRRAAVAVILADLVPGVPGLLLIRRADRADDPWSGHVAFPGGRADQGDRDLVATARRETAEETGIQLPADAVRATGDDIRAWREGRPAPVLVTPVVFHIEEAAPAAPSAEVSFSRWVPLSELVNPQNLTTHAVFGMTHPAIRARELLVWGLTYRVLKRLFTVAGVAELP